MKKTRTKSRSKTKLKPRSPARPVAKTKTKTKAQPRPRSKSRLKTASRRVFATGKTESSSAFYLYGITSGDTGVNTAACPGIDGNYKVRAVGADGLACWISEVDRRQFVTHLERHMENLEWLASAGVHHQATVEKLAAQTTIVPARFGAVFASLDSLREDIHRRAAQLADTLRRLRGAEEWGVKIFFAPQRESAGAPASSGREYLAQKAKSLNAARSRSVPAEELSEFLRELQKGSLDWAPGKTGAGQHNLVWNAAFLLKKRERAGFEATLRNFAGRWQRTHQIECTGPWPPYSFV